MARPTRLSLVTVVFETEFALLDLQARSLAAYVQPDDLASIIVIDNSARGMGAGTRRRLLGQYGPHRDAVRIVRPEEITEVPAASGWLVQQVLKLVVADLVPTSHYLVLDAKDHFVRHSSVADFVAEDGRARVPAYSYVDHPLRLQLENVLAYLGIDPEPYRERFSATVTPFTLETAQVRRMRAGIAARRPDNDFAAEFVEHGLLEFFLYAGWLLAERGSLDAVFELQEESCPKVWKGTANTEGVEAAIDAANRLGTPVFSVHRRALPRLPLAAVRELAAFWVERGLFASRRDAVAFALAFRVQYVVREVRRKLPGRIRALLSRG